MIAIFIYLAGLHLVALFLYFRYKKTYTALTTTISQKKSSEVRLGFAAETFAPFLKVFKHAPEQTKFLGMPIDYIVFGDDLITFVEIKSVNAKLSQKQRNIKKLIQDKKVAWEEIRIGDPKELIETKNDS